MLRQLQHTFPQVDIKYDPDTSSTTPIVLHIRPHLDLLFSGIHQRLHTICLRKLRDPHPPVTLRYKDTILSSTEEVLRRVGVSRTFGPTYPGDDLRYPGLWFSFEEDGMGDGLKGVQAEDRAQEVKRVFISQKDNDDKNRDALGEVAECPVMHGDLALAVVKVRWLYSLCSFHNIYIRSTQVHDGVTLSFYPSPSDPIHIRIGQTTAQDLNLGLGPPLRIHYKEDERMTIHSKTRSDNERESDCATVLLTDISKITHQFTDFYNYFQHGVDFLLSGKTNIVKKIIIHSNVVCKSRLSNFAGIMTREKPGSALFQRYKRCNWEIEGPPEDDEDGKFPMSSQ